MPLDTTETAPIESNTSEEVVNELDNELADVTLEDLLNLDEDRYPEFKEENHKGMKPLAHWMQHVPEEVRKHLANIRSDYTRKTQEISRIRSSLEEKEREILAKNEHIMRGPLAEKLSSINTTEEYDLFDPEGMRKEIQRQAGLMLKEMLEPAQKELEVQQRKLALDNFKAQNPELTSPEYKKPILELLAERPELKLEDAFYIVKAKIDSQKLSEERLKVSNQKAARKDIALKSSVGSRTAVSETPKFRSAIEAYNWHKANGMK